MKAFLALAILLVGLQCSLANVLPLFQEISTVPANGDVNPYGLAFIPKHFCSSTLNEDDILVANFNNATNVQGTGTTVSLLNSKNPQPVAGTFFTSELLGLSGAFGLLRSGFILVGNVPFDPAANGNVGIGKIQVLDCKAEVVAVLDARFGVTDPWGLTVYEDCDEILIFVSNANPHENGTVVRIRLSNPPDFDHAHFTVIGSGFLSRPDPAAFVLGPAGLAYDPEDDVLFVAAEGDNAIFKIPQAAHRYDSAGKGVLVFNDQVHLHGPLGLILTKEGHLITANADSIKVDPNQPSELVEFTRKGKFLAQFSIDPANGGAFELAFGVVSKNLRVLGALDDNVPSLKLYSQGPAVFHHHQQHEDHDEDHH
jgi:hypothetical protein